MTRFQYIGSTDYAHKATPRNSKIKGVIIHHADTTDVRVVQRMFATTAYEVSANAIGTARGIIAAVPENMRAWTSGSKYDGGKGAQFDHERATIEFVNKTRSPDYLIDDETYEHGAAWIAYLADKYGFAINRDTVIGHRELWTRYGASYPTACPGGIDLDRLVRMARESQAAAQQTPEEREDAEIMAAKDEILAEIRKQSRQAGVPYQVIYTNRPGHSLVTPIGVTGIWWDDLEAIRNVITALDYQRREKASAPGTLSIAYARGGSRQADLDVFNLYLRAIATDTRVGDPKKRGNP